MKVFKFGGASVKSPEAVRNVCYVLKNHSKQKEVLVVVSAMGKTTNMLENLLHNFYARDNYQVQLNQIKDYHLDIIRGLFPDENSPIYALVDKQFYLLEADLLQPPTDNVKKHYDQVVGYGELISSTIVAEYLNQEGVPCQWVDARKYIQTDETWKEGQVDYAWSTKLIKADLPAILSEKVIMTQGFIGGTIAKKTVTLGREGSDFSAAIFAHCLDAESVTIWKDVPGVLNADPKRVTETVLYKYLPYSTAVEMTYYGASVIHPKTIRPLAIKNIPLLVRSFVNPEIDGTTIGNFVRQDLEPALIFKPQQSLLVFETHNFSNVNNHNLNTIFNVLDMHNVKVNVTMNTAMSVTLCCNTEKDKFVRVTEQLSDQFKISIQDQLELVTILNCRDKPVPNLFKNDEVLLRLSTEDLLQVVRVDKVGYKVKGG